MGGGGDGKEVWETATMAEEDNIMEQAAELMKLHKVPRDFRQFVSDCSRYGGGAIEEWDRELDVRKWGLELLKAVIADGSVNSGEWDSLLCSAVLPVPMPAFMLSKVLAYALEVAAEKRGGEEVEEKVVVEEEVVVDKEVVVGSSCGGEEIVGRDEGVGKSEGVGKWELCEEEKICEEKEPIGEKGKERVWEAVLPSSWGTLLPAASPPTISNLSPIWRPWEIEKRTTVEVKLPWKPGQGRRKRRSPAAEARSQRRLHDWQQRVDLQRGFNRLHSEQRNIFTPKPAPKEIWSVRLVERLGDVKGRESGGGQSLPSNQCYFGDERRGILGSGGEGQGLYAGGLQKFSSLLQIPTPIATESSFPTPPPPPSWSAKWRGDWWLVPAGMSTQCASCLLWGPLSPGG